MCRREKKDDVSVQCHVGDWTVVACEIWDEQSGERLRVPGGEAFLAA